MFCLKRIKFISMMAAAVLLLASSAMAADAPLDYDDFTILEGFGTDFGCNYGGGVSQGQIGVSKYINADYSIYKTGAIQVFYDDGRMSGSSLACEGNIQVFAINARVAGAPQGITNTAFSIKVPSLCATGDCQWSTMFVAPQLNPDGTLNEDAGDFPSVVQRPIRVVGQPSVELANEVVTNWQISDLGERTGNIADGLAIKQYVRSHPGKPYFDITWDLHLSGSTPLENVKMWYTVDTFTSGVDFGYGYCCDITPIAGASGGALFFQGIIGLQKVFKEAENTWGQVFNMMANDTVPYYSSNPLDPSAANPAPLRELVDNGFILQWGCDPDNSDDTTIGCDSEDTISIEPGTHKYINVRWTFDDPIRASTYGTAQALLELNRDDKETLFDVHFDPTDWRGYINAYVNPKDCRRDQDCTNPGETCMIQPGCVDGSVKCPRYCAVQTCTQDSDCLGRYCLFGFCVERKWETEPELVSTGNDDRVIFTFDPSGSKIEFTTANAGALMSAMGVSDVNQAEDLIAWARGELQESGDPTHQKIIDENDTMDVDLANTNLLRTRTDDSGEDWTLGDITHARPIYVGEAPLNPELLRTDDVPGRPKYADFVNSSEYQHRQKVLIVAANDGMLHAFDAETGEELWAFIPWAVLPKLKELAAPYYEKLRSPMLDLTPTVRDVFDPTSNSWKTVIILGMRGGGNYYYALDITNAHITDPLFLWSFTDPDLGLSYARPQTARVQINSTTHTEMQIVVLGSGYAETQAEQLSKEGYVFLLDMFNTITVSGELRPAWATGDAGTSKILITDTSGGSTVHLYNNVVTGATVADDDRDGFDEKAYVADLYGNLWRITFPSDGTNIAVYISKLINTGAPFSLTVYNKRLGSGASGASQTYTYDKVPRPISGMPASIITSSTTSSGGDFMGHSDNNDKAFVMFGTGKFDSFYDSFDKFVENPDDDPSNWTYYYQYIMGVVDRSTETDCQYSSCDLSSFEVNMDELQTNTIQTFDNGDYRLIDTPSSPTCVDNDDGCKGWKIELHSIPENIGERVVTDPQVVDRYLFLTTFVPNGQGTCDIRGVSDAGGGYLMVVNIEDGGNPKEAILDKDFNGIVNEDDNISGSYVSGMRFTGGILSAPVVDAVSGSVYFKTGTDVMPTRIHIKAMGKFKGSKTIFYRVKY